MGKSKGEIGTTFEYLNGGTLKQRLKERSTGYTEAEARRLFVQLALVFKEIHGNSIMHKNIDNTHVLFVGAEGQEDGDFLKLTGFSNLREMAHDNSVASVISTEQSFCPPETMDGGTYTRA